MIQAVLFDMDGVLVDSERYIAEAAIRMFAERGVSVSVEDFTPFVGAGENRYIGGVAEAKGVRLDVEEAKARTYAIYAEIVADRLQPIAGAKEFVADAARRGLKLAVATSADRVKLDVNLRVAGFAHESFAALVDGTMVEHRKPAPDIYLLAARMLGVAPEHALVVEDALSGIAAARAAGCRCLGVASSFSCEELSADWCAATLAEAPPACLQW